MGESYAMNLPAQKIADELPETDGTAECIAFRINVDGTLDYAPLPLAMRNLWLFNNTGGANDVS